jgi:hypothetical protein
MSRHQKVAVNRDPPAAIAEVVSPYHTPVLPMAGMPKLGATVADGAGICGPAIPSTVTAQFS